MDKRRRMQKELDYCFEKASIIKPPECFNYGNKFSKFFVCKNVWKPIYLRAVLFASSGKTMKISDLTEQELEKAKELSIKYIDEWFNIRQKELES